MCKNGVPLTDVEIVQRLIGIIQQIDRDRIEMIGTIKKLESHILEKYGEIYQESLDK